MIWKSRCRKLFDNQDWHPVNLIYEVFRYIKLYNLDRNPLVTRPVPHSTIWLPPPHDHWKINFDASYVINNHQAGIGLVLRDFLGMCRGVRMILARLQSSEEAEAKAALEAVKWGISLQLQKIHIEGDAQIIINYLTTTTNSSIGWRSKAHLDEARSLFGNYQSIFFFYVPRLVNSVADALASMARTSTSECSLTEVPSFIFDVLNSDSATIRALPTA
ncbi:hypothetical protein BVC80_59g59 [Macleaya cordata]|uniref:RNase H type-1 domain-containing protein n=1 Tax=Macleaya cordata TaxID=56857 RepID=A0A200QJL4_MACCD|nr:hypothetical protein BVC80_59g59 [Macleaya cordata]